MMKLGQDTVQSQLDAMRCGDVLYVLTGPHRFQIIRTTMTGGHSGRPRYLVVCATCEELLHEATTGPIHQMGYHLDDANGVMQPPTDATFAESAEPMRRALAVLELRVARKRLRYRPGPGHEGEPRESYLHRTRLHYLSAIGAAEQAITNALNIIDPTGTDPE